MDGELVCFLGDHENQITHKEMAILKVNYSHRGEDGPRITYALRLWQIKSTWNGNDVKQLIIIIKYTLQDQILDFLNAEKY